MTTKKVISISTRNSDDELWKWAREQAQEKRLSLSAFIAYAVQIIKDSENEDKEAKDGNS